MHWDRNKTFRTGWDKSILGRRVWLVLHLKLKYMAKFEFSSQFCYRVPASPWANHLKTLNFRFSICKLGIISIRAFVRRICIAVVSNCSKQIWGPLWYVLYKQTGSYLTSFSWSSLLPTISRSCYSSQWAGVGYSEPRLHLFTDPLLTAGRSIGWVACALFTAAWVTVSLLHDWVRDTWQSKSYMDYLYSYAEELHDSPWNLVYWFSSLGTVGD